MSLFSSLKMTALISISFGLCISCLPPESKRVRSAVGPAEVPAKAPSAADSESQCKDSPETSCGPFSAEEISACLKFSPKTSQAQNACNGGEWDKKFHEEIAIYLKQKQRSSEPTKTVANSQVHSATDKMEQ